MESVIEKIYKAHLEENMFLLNLVDKDATNEEWRKYDFLYGQLMGEEKEAFNRYVELRGLRQTEELKTAYEQGFKTAIKLFVEALKE